MKIKYIILSLIILLIPTFVKASDVDYEITNYYIDSYILENGDVEIKELIVLKNNQPSAIILSPEEYTRLTEIEEDYFLLLEATKRIGANGDKKVIPIDAVMTDLGISKEELMDTEDVDIE